MKTEGHILIVGAGIVGLTAAALLSQLNKRYRIHVIDANKPANFNSSEDLDLRVSALSKGSMEIFEKLGVWEEITAKRAFPYRSMRVWDGNDVADGLAAINFEASEFGLSELGFITENNRVQAKLKELIEVSDVSLHYNTSIRSMDRVKNQNSLEIQLSDNQNLHIDLLIGADGANSATRKLFDVQMTEHDYQQKGFVVHVETEYDHKDTAWQRFLTDGPIALLPLGKKEASIVWSTTNHQIKFNKTLTNDSLSKLLSETTDYALGNLKVISKCADFDLKYQHAKTYTRDNFAIIGDAAHSIHPLAGQGLNLGIADANCLVKVINRAIKNHEYIGDRYSLRAFEREQKSANWMMLNFVDTLHKLFLNSSSVIENMRGLGMRLFNRNIFLKRYAMKNALGIDL